MYDMKYRCVINLVRMYMYERSTKVHYSKKKSLSVLIINLEKGVCMTSWIITMVEV